LLLLRTLIRRNYSYTHPQEFFAQHVNNRSTSEGGSENVSLRQVRRPNLGVDLWAWLPAKAVFWGIVATLDIIFMIVSYVKMTKTAINIYAGVEKKRNFYLKTSNEKVGCCSALETKFARAVWCFVSCFSSMIYFAFVSHAYAHTHAKQARWMSCSNPQRLTMVLQILVGLLLGFCFLYVWLQLAAIISNIISLRVMQELGLIDLLSSPVRLHLLVVNVRTLVSAETINNVQIPAYEAMSKVRIDSMMAQIAVFNNQQGARLEKFNTEYCKTLKQLSIDRCVPLAQRIAEPVLRPCQMAPIVPSVSVFLFIFLSTNEMNLLVACSYLQDSMFMLIMKEFEYLYCRKLLLLLLLLLLLSFLKSKSCSTHTNSYVDALRDVVTSAIYVPMFVGCILVLMVLCKKIVLVVFAKTSLVRTRYLLQFHSSIDPRDHPDVYVFFFKSTCDLSFVLIDFFSRYKRDAEEIIEQEEFQEYSRREKRKTWKEFNPLFGRTNNNNNNNNHGDVGVAEQYGQAAQIEMQPATLHRQQTAMSENFPTIPRNVRA
jgi:hypothetical protein